MKKTFRCLLCLTLAFSMIIPFSVFARGQDSVNYTITNPYAGVESLLGDMSNHYKTNLHTHSTYSDASTTLKDMVMGYYERDFDVLAMADHGVLGVEWNKAPTTVPLYAYQYLAGNTKEHLTDEQYAAVTAGTFAGTARANQRGLQCVTDAIEANMVLITKAHVNGYFTDACENYWGFENDYEGAVRMIENSGGVSHINHPGDWLGSAGNPDAARDPENVKLFADIYRKYGSCLGMEILNRVDSVTRSDRILWDEILKAVIPEGNRNVWGFANSDAHKISDIDTSFMDFIMPSYSQDNLRSAMESGAFFAVGRRAKNELGDDFVGSGAYPQVISVAVDDEADTITITGINCSAIEWVADGEIIESETIGADGTMTSVISLRDKSDSISCYVRAQLKGSGGICFTQPFVCDDGNMQRFVIEDGRTQTQVFIDRFIYILKSARIYVLIQEIFK